MAQCRLWCQSRNDGAARVDKMPGKDMPGFSEGFMPSCVENCEREYEKSRRAQPLTKHQEADTQQGSEQGRFNYDDCRTDCERRFSIRQKDTFEEKVRKGEGIKRCFEVCINRMKVGR